MNNPQINLETILKSEIEKKAIELKSEYKMKMNSQVTNSIFYYQYQSKILAIEELERKLYKK